MLTYFYWIIAGLLAIPAIIGIGIGLALMFLGLMLGCVVLGVLCCPIAVWLVLADARFWRSLTTQTPRHN